MTQPITLRYNGVQVLRLVAALLVVGTHATAYTAQRVDPTLPVWNFGTIGVPVFFAISGFVMVHSTASHIGVPKYWRAFAIRRAVRIVPIYWIATVVKIGAMVIAPAAAFKAVLNPGSAIGSFFFIPYHIVGGKAEPLLGVGWTLVFEVFFYLLFTVALLVRIDPLWFCGGIFGAFALLSLVRPPGQWPLWMVFFDPIVLYFLVGIVVGRWVERRSTRRLLAEGGAVLVVLLVITAADASTWTASSQPWIGPARLLVIGAVLFGVVALEPVYGHRVPRVLLFGGAASYSLYLFHSLVAPPVPALLARLGVTSAGVSIAACFVVAILVSSVIYRWVEKPLTIVLQRRLLPRRDAAPQVADQPLREPLTPRT